MQLPATLQAPIRQPYHQIQSLGNPAAETVFTYMYPYKVSIIIAHQAP